MSLQGPIVDFDYCHKTDSLVVIEENINMIAHYTSLREIKPHRLILKDSIKNITRVSFDQNGTRIAILGQNRSNKDLLIILQIEPKNTTRIITTQISECGSRDINFFPYDCDQLITCGL